MLFFYEDKINFLALIKKATFVSRLANFRLAASLGIKFCLNPEKHLFSILLYCQTLFHITTAATPVKSPLIGEQENTIGRCEAVFGPLVSCNVSGLPIGQSRRVVICSWSKPIPPGVGAERLRKYRVHHRYYMGGPSGDRHHQTW